MTSNPYASPQSSGTDSSSGSRKVATWRRIAGVLLLVLGVAMFVACLRVFVLFRADAYLAHNDTGREAVHRQPVGDDERIQLWAPLEDTGSHVSEEFAIRMLILPLFSGALALTGAWIGFRRRTALWVTVLVVASVLAFEFCMMFGPPTSMFS